eukprot:6313084-Prymnesium_polylepis.1
MPVEECAARAESAPTGSGRLLRSAVPCWAADVALMLLVTAVAVVSATQFSEALVASGQFVRR